MEKVVKGFFRVCLWSLLVPAKLLRKPQEEKVPEIAANIGKKPLHENKWIFSPFRLEITRPQTLNLPKLLTDRSDKCKKDQWRR
jgi:hypothetical protein